MSADSGEWKEGAVVMMDALGFKGIWRYHGPDEVLARMHLIERCVRKLLDIPSVRLAREAGFEDSITFLSDTIILAFSDPKRPQGVVSLATAAAGYALHAAATDTQDGSEWGCSLAYRGAISFGRFHVEDRYVLGPAIDEAAEAMDRPEGAFVYLTRSARDLFKQHSPRPVAARWMVPLKTKRVGCEPKIDEFETWVASPFAHDAGAQGMTWEVAELILKTFDRGVGDESVLRKRVNTEAFLRHAHEEHEAALAVAQRDD